MDKMITLSLDEYNELIQAKECLDKGNVLYTHFEDSNMNGSYFSQTFKSYITTTDALDDIKKDIDRMKAKNDKLDSLLQSKSLECTKIKNLSVFEFFKYKIGKLKL